MNPTVSCVRCGTTVPRPKDRRSRCATCGTALPLFDDDPNLPVPELPVPDRLVPGRSPVAAAAAPPPVARQISPGELLPERPAARDEHWDDFKLEPSEEHALPAATAAAPRPAPSARPPAPQPRPAVPAQAARPATAPPAPRRSVTPLASLAQPPAAATPIPQSTTPSPAGPPPAAPSTAPGFDGASGQGERSKAPLILAVAVALVALVGGAAYLLRGDPTAPAKGPPDSSGARPVAPPVAAPLPPAAEVLAEPVLPAATPPAAPAPAPAAEARPAPRPTPAARVAAVPEPSPPPARPARAAAPEPKPDRPAAPAAPLVAPTAAAALPIPAPAPAPAPAAPPTPAPQATAPAAAGPSYAAEGSKKPRLLEATCIADNLRLPRDAPLEPGEVVRVRFAVGLEGRPEEFTIVGTPGDPRIGNAIWSAIQRCRFSPGTDSKGNPAVLWVVMPFRFDAR
jgi:TonB family protein